LVRNAKYTVWTATSDSKSLGLVFQARAEPTSAGSPVIVRMDLRPHGLARLATPILSRVMQGQEIRNLAAIKRTLGARPGADAALAGAPPCPGATHR